MYILYFQLSILSKTFYWIALIKALSAQVLAQSISLKIILYSKHLQSILETFNLLFIPTVTWKRTSHVCVYASLSKSLTIQSVLNY